MPPAGRGRVPCTPFILFFKFFLPPHHLKRGGVVRARAVGCLAEPGIVCFPAAHRSKRINVSNPKAGKHYEASEGVPADLDRTAPTRDSRHSKRMPPACRGRIPCTPFILFFTFFLPPHHLKRFGVIRAGAVGCLTEPGIVCFPADHRSKRIIVSNPKAGKHYEASEGVPADLVRTAPTRDSRLPHLLNVPSWTRKKRNAPANSGAYSFGLSDA